MAIILEANYSKKLGLPGYSSHQYSVTVKTEVTDPNQVPVENARLYALLQSCVDQEIQKTGFLPEPNQTNANGRSQSRLPGNGGGNGNGYANAEAWQCSPKQQDLILKIVDEHKLDKRQVEQLAQDRFGKSVKALNKLEASGLIEELIAQTGGTANPRRRYNRPTPANTR